MSLLEQEAIRMAAALEDSEHVRVSEIGGSERSGYWLCVTDERLGLGYEIASHANYWDFLGYFAPPGSSGPSSLLRHQLL